MIQRQMLRLLLVIFVLFPGFAQAADTLETVPDDNFYMETTFGALNLGQEAQRTMISASVMLAYGMNDRLTSYIIAGGNTNLYMTKGVTNLGVGLYGVLVKMPHFKLDLGLQAGVGRTGLTTSVGRSRMALKDEFVLAPSLELNFDLKKDEKFIGFYLVFQEIFTGVEEEKDGQLLGYFTPSSYLRAGAYWSIVPGKYQVHLQFDMNINHFDTTIITDLVVPAVDIGGIAVGFNFFVTETIEILTEVYIDIPQNQETIAFGFSIGIAE